MNDFKQTPCGTMINLKSTEYLNPTKDFRKLSVLLAIHHEPDLRQQDIANQAHMSGAMANSYIKQMKNCGCIEIENKNRRDLKYRLTQKGHQQLTQHLLACSAEIVELYREAKCELIKQFQTLFINENKLKVALFGGSETARLVLSVLENFKNIEIVAVVDNDEEKWGVSLNCHVIQQPSNLENLQVDCIVISSFARQEEIFEAIRFLNQKGVRIVKLSSL